MKFLKALVIVLLSFLLFLSLSIFGVVLTLNHTILDPDFVILELNKLDVSSLARDLCHQVITQDEPYITEVLDNTITELEPWIREQVKNSIHAGYDYLLDKRQSFNLEISLDPVRNSLKDNFRKAILHSPPPELAGRPSAELERYIAEVYQYVDEMIPLRVELSETLMSTEVLAQLEQIKQAISYTRLAYYLLIGLILLLILGIILINREVKNTSRELGIIFITYGAIEYLGIFIAKNLTKPQLSQLDIPSALQAWLPQLLDDFLAPLEILSLGFLAAGIALLIVSFLYKPHQPSSEPEPLP